MLKNEKIFEGGERKREAQRIIIAGSPNPFFKRREGILRKQERIF
jgi:hypothetical protein